MSEGWREEQQVSRCAIPDKSAEFVRDFQLGLGKSDVAGKTG
jgi:hypothetical protein